MGIFRSVVIAMVAAIRGFVKYGFHCMKIPDCSVEKLNDK